jgi:hypothetical protein
VHFKKPLPRLTNLLCSTGRLLDDDLHGARRPPQAPLFEVRFASSHVWHLFVFLLFFLLCVCHVSSHRRHHGVSRAFEQMLGRHIATNPVDPHCVNSRQCYNDTAGHTIKDVCNHTINNANPALMEFQNGNEVCGAFWTDELLIATCGTRPFAEQYAKNQQKFFKDYRRVHVGWLKLICFPPILFHRLSFALSTYPQVTLIDFLFFPAGVRIFAWRTRRASPSPRSTTIPCPRWIGGTAR